MWEQAFIANADYDVTPVVVFRDRGQSGAVADWRAARVGVLMDQAVEGIWTSAVHAGVTLVKLIQLCSLD